MGVPAEGPEHPDLPRAQSAACGPTAVGSRPDCAPLMAGDPEQVISPSQAQLPRQLGRADRAARQLPWLQHTKAAGLIPGRGTYKKQPMNVEVE